MAIHTRFTRFVAVIGTLSVAGASVARAQDTSAAARSDTSAYRGYQNQADTAQAGQQGARTDSIRTDSTGFKYNGPPTDTTLKAEPGAQTGPSAGDTSHAARSARAAGRADTVVCKDGSNAAKAKSACGQHGGIDWAATRTALKARGRVPGHGADSASGHADTAQGYQPNGTSADTALKAKPGTQTGADTSAAGQSDTGSARYKNP